MSIEIAGIPGQSGGTRPLPGEARPQRMPTLTEQAAARPPQSVSSSANADMDLDTLVDDLRTVTSAFDRRLKFTVNRELNQVVVKVIDRRTDKVIKELPPKEIQRLHVRIREALGLLIDEEI
jgi:flagellar protein FlaG